MVEIYHADSKNRKPRPKPTNQPKSNLTETGPKFHYQLNSSFKKISCCNLSYIQVTAPPPFTITGEKL